jgi:hypothetical protein
LPIANLKEEEQRMMRTRVGARIRRRVDDRRRVDAFDLVEKGGGDVGANGRVGERSEVGVTGERRGIEADNLVGHVSGCDVKAR